MRDCPLCKNPPPGHRRADCSFCSSKGNMGIGMAIAGLLAVGYVWSWAFVTFSFVLMFMFFVRPIWWPPVPHEELSKIERDKLETLCWSCFGGWQTTWVVTLFLAAGGHMPAWNPTSLLKGLAYGVLVHTKLRLKRSRVVVETKVTSLDVILIFLIETVPPMLVPLFA